MPKVIFLCLCAVLLTACVGAQATPNLAWSTTVNTQKGGEYSTSEQASSQNASPKKIQLSNANLHFDHVCQMENKVHSKLFSDFVANLTREERYEVVSQIAEQQYNGSLWNLFKSHHHCPS
ncbi:MAG: hypothetical protein AAF228_10370 [Pseudomonadota bacterium]